MWPSVWLGFLVVWGTQGSWTSYTVAQGSKCERLSEKADIPSFISQPHLHHLLVEAITSPSRFRGGA